MSRTFHVENLGCAKNQVDAELMIASLQNRGWTLAPGPQEAELLIVNSCGFIKQAKRQSIEAGLDLRTRFPRACILMAGCLSERYAEELARNLPEIDGFLGNRDPTRVVELAEELTARRPPGSRSSRAKPAVQPSAAPRAPRVLRPSADGRSLSALPRTRLLSFPGSAYLKVSEGCDNRCSYCAIPLIRGNLRSRGTEEVMAEARELLDGGRVRELVLVAQDLGSFGWDRGKGELAMLLRKLARLKGDFWIRLLYIHPDHFPFEILPIIRGEGRLLPYFDVPFQHASPRILAAMNRRPDPEANLSLLQRIRRELPEAAIRSTFLVGFPGEDDGDFERLTAFQQDASLDWLGVFTYSREEDTPAYGLPGCPPARVAARRKALLEEQQVPITWERLDRHIGKTVDVLAEEPIEGEELALGRAWFQAPEVDGAIVVRGTNLDPGSVVRVRIDRRNGFDMEGCPQ